MKLGYGHLPKEKREEIGKRHSICMKEKFKQDSTTLLKMVEKRNIPICLIDEENKIIKIYKSSSEAGRELNIKNTHITKVCKNKQKKTGGLRFCYYKNIEIAK